MGGWSHSRSSSPASPSAAAEAEDVAALVGRASERRVHAGETLIEQRDTSRDVFGILEDDFRVRDAGREVLARSPVARDLVARTARERLALTKE